MTRQLLYSPLHQMLNVQKATQIFRLVKKHESLSPFFLAQFLWNTGLTFNFDALCKHADRVISSFYSFKGGAIWDWPSRPSLVIFSWQKQRPKKKGYCSFVCTSALSWPWLSKGPVKVICCLNFSDCLAAKPKRDRILLTGPWHVMKSSKKSWPWLEK